MTARVVLETLAELDAALDRAYASSPWTARLTDGEIVALVVRTYQLSPSLISAVAAAIMAWQIADAPTVRRRQLIH
ncbi:MAG: hypothetical protein M3295_05155 [Chloroflexota bacterium]|nr:hypothetical protein [Chloroflexota bacterium]